jgi:hypothetical protein
LSLNRVLLSFEPAALHAVQLAGLLTRRVVARHHTPVNAAPERAAWQGALAALQDGLAAWNDLRGEAAIVLSNAFVRYAVVPHAGQLTGSEERIALSRAQFAKTHGERVREWDVRIAPCARGEPGLAIAADAALIEGIKLCFSGKRRLRLASIQPYLMSAYNCWRGRVPAAGAWIVLTEPERTCVALLEERRWVGVSVTRESAPSAVDGCVALVERERARQAAKGPPSVLTTLDDVEARPSEDAPYAMALTAR